MLPILGTAYMQNIGTLNDGNTFRIKFKVHLNIRIPEVHVLLDFIQFVGHMSRRLPDERVENVTKNRQKVQKKSHQVR